MVSKKSIISIVIPVRNGMDTLPRLMEGIKNQSLFHLVEVVVVDSASTDGSVDYLAQLDFVKVIAIDPKTFNHGQTRNLGATHCNGEFVVMTVQDAWPTDSKWLENMHSHFKDSEVMGVCGQQVVPHHNDKNPHEWFRPQNKGQVDIVQFKDTAEFWALSPKQQKQACRWDDVVAMYRAKALQDLPFQKMIYGEDKLWAKMALEKGYKLVYDTTVRIYHYHFQFPSYTYKRVLISKLFAYKCFGYIDDRAPNLKRYALVIYRNLKWKVPLKWIWHNIKIIYTHRRANRAFLNALKQNKLANIEQELALDIPIGQQNKNIQ